MTATSSLRQLVAATRVLLVLTVLTGIAYPLAITAIAQVIAPDKANGSRVQLGGKVIGSTLIAQRFDGPQWFHPRPSAAGDGYDTLSSSASNLGPNNPELAKSIRANQVAYAKENGVAVSNVPADAVTGSGSGLDPHISLANARIQARRVAEARGLSPAKVRGLVEQLRQGRTLGVLGGERVNVLELNLRLAKL